jgi:predicted GNAT family N-acyltransferase
LDDVAYQYASFQEGQVLGSVRLLDLKDIQNDNALISRYSLQEIIKEWGRDVIAFTGRMAVAEKFRKSSLVLRLMAIATDEARHRGMRLAFLDCSPHLLPFYEACGFKRYAPLSMIRFSGLNNPCFSCFGIRLVSKR